MLDSAVAARRTGRVQAAAKITSVAVLVCLATFGFSRGTGRLAESMTAPVGTFSLIAAIVLTVWAPARFGWRWGAVPVASGDWCSPRSPESRSSGRTGW